MTVASAKDGRSTQEVPFFVDPTNWMDIMPSASCWQTRPFEVAHAGKCTSARKTSAI